MSPSNVIAFPSAPSPDQVLREELVPVLQYWSERAAGEGLPLVVFFDLVLSALEEATEELDAGDLHRAVTDYLARARS